MLENFLFILNVVLPVFLLVIIGIFLRLIKLLDESFVKLTSNFVYKVSLPVLIFLKLHKVDFGRTFDPNMIIVIIFGIFTTAFIAYLIAKILKMKPEDEGVFVQGAFRSNYAIVGLAIIMRMFGVEAVSKASFLLLFALPLYNLFGVISLTIPFNSIRNTDFKKLTKEIFTNPLILAVFVSAPFSIFGVGIHPTLETTGNYLAEIALPLALIGIGASFNISSIKSASQFALLSSGIKNILSPLIVIPPAILLGIEGNDLAIIFIIFGCPTAIASFIMAAGMRGNIKLAGNIVIISTLGAIFSMTLGLFLLKYFKLF
ncbi:MAG: AEC family transporter [Melioribacteraceae bacterium]|nr:AEC family transporter [Melioribacteraceae bacterium]